MLDASSHGHVALKTKSINVEANLLSQRLEERRLIRDELRKRIAIAAIVVIALLAGFPPVYKFHSAQADRYRKAKAQDELLSARLANIQQQQQSLQPAIEDQQLVGSLKRHGNEVLGQLLLFLNHVNPRVALSSVSTAIKDGEIHINTSGVAIDYDAAAKFIAESANGPNSKGTILSTMGIDQSLGLDGVNFNFMKKIKVSP